MKTWIVLLLLFTQQALASDEARFDAYVMKEAHRSGITVSQVFRLWDVESGKLRDATPDGKLGECGRAQIMIATARMYEPLITKAELRTKWVNTRIMFKHLRTLRAQLQEAGVDNDLLPVLMFTAYNCGMTKVLAGIAAHKHASSKYGRHIAWGAKYP